MIRTPLGSKLATTGRFPQVSLAIKSLDTKRTLLIDRFLSYNFSSSIVVPVDTFSFTFSSSDPQAFTDYVREGDLVSLKADDADTACGIIDQIEVSVDEQGEQVTVSGRDLMSQLEDNHAVSPDKKPIWGNKMTLRAVADALRDETRIENVTLIDAPGVATLFATEPGESRLSALMRFMEAYNVTAWMDSTGGLVIGKPDFASSVIQNLILDRTNRASNVISMRATRSATTIPGRIVVLWSDVQSTQVGIPDNQIFKNAAQGPARLLSKGHTVIKTLMTSLPNGADAQALAASAKFQTAAAANETILQAEAKREFARANFNELLVQCVVPGHYNDQGAVFMPNAMYHVIFDRASVDENMFLYGVEWNLSPERGQYTVLSLCKPNTIVSDTKIPAAGARG